MYSLNVAAVADMVGVDHGHRVVCWPPIIMVMMHADPLVP